MANWEQRDAILKWMAKFDVETDDFLQDPWTLLNGRVLSQIYNTVSEDSIDPNSMKVLSSGADWVNGLLNMRTLSVRISPLLKLNNVDSTADFSSIARKTDEGEFIRFLKYFFFYCVKSPGRSEAISRVRLLEKPVQHHIQKVLQEFLRPSSGKSEPRPAPSPATASTSGDATALQARISALQAREEELTRAIAEKRQEVESEVNIQSRMEEAAAAARASLEAAEARERELREELDRVEANGGAVAREIARFQQMEANAARAAQGSGGDLSVHQLEDKLALLKRRVGGDAEVKGGVTDKKKEWLEVEARLVEMRKECERKTAEASALRKTMTEQMERAAQGLLRRVAQLNAEMDKSAIGEAKRASLKYRRIQQKLTEQIEKLRREGGKEELDGLRDELNRMTEMKSRESELLARKLSFMQSTFGQCNLRLQRLKVQVGLQTHTNRLQRWKNCF